MDVSVHDVFALCVADLQVLNAAKIEISELQHLCREKKHRVALTRVDKLITSIGTNFRCVLLYVLCTSLCV